MSVNSVPEFTPFERKCIELMQGGPRSHAQLCFRSALLHLEKARQLLEHDPAMAVFRGITAEEEAASGLMRCLQDLNYDGAERLNPHNHTHKHAVFQFIRIVGLFFRECKDTLPETKLRLLNKEAGVRLVIELMLPNGMSAMSEMPLHFSVKERETKEWVSFDSQIRRFEVAQRAGTVKAFLKAEANRRNEILYASSSALPAVVRDGGGFIAERQRRAIVMLYAYLMICPYSEHQLFVSYSLAQFLELLCRLGGRHNQGGN